MICSSIHGLLASINFDHSKPTFSHNPHPRFRGNLSLQSLMDEDELPGLVRSYADHVILLRWLLLQRAQLASRRVSATEDYRPISADSTFQPVSF